jgi:hypothetical protein
MNSLLDPYVLAIPDLTAHEEDCIKYAETLENWSGSINEGLHKILLSYPLVDALVEANQYPLESNLRRIRGLQAILSSFDAFRSCERQLTSPPFIEDHIPRIADLPANELAELIVLPEQLEKRLHPDVALALRKTLAAIAIAADVHKSDFAQTLMFGTTGLNNNENQNVKINTSEIKWKFVLHPEDLDDMESWENLWMYTQRGINRAYRQLCRDHALDPKTQYCPEPNVGEKFNDVIVENGYFRDETLMKILFRNIVLGLLNTGGYERHKYADDNPHHPLQNAPARRDGATAWRLYLGDYRLHYWLLSDGSAELSKMGVHNDFTII